jgi:hypothetical protein
MLVYHEWFDAREAAFLAADEDVEAGLEAGSGRAVQSRWRDLYEDLF